MSDANKVSSDQTTKALDGSGLLLSRSTADYTERSRQVRETLLQNYSDEDEQLAPIDRLSTGFIELVKNAPTAVGARLTERLQNEPLDVAGNMAISGVTGFLGTILLRRAPLLAASVIGLGSVYETLRQGTNAIKYGGALYQSQSRAELNQTIDRTVEGFAKEGAWLIESAPAFLAGTGSAYKLTPKISILENLASKAALPEAAMRSAIPDSWHWRGPGTARLDVRTKHSDGHFDFNAISENLAGRHPWSGVEVGRVIDLNDMRLSRSYPGTANSVHVGAITNNGNAMFHTHPHDFSKTLPGVDRLNIKNSAIPSSVDVRNMNSPVGLIQSGDVSTIYMNGRTRHIVSGMGDFLSNSPPTPVPLPLEAVLIDRRNRVAARVEGIWPVMKSDGHKSLYGSDRDVVATVDFLDYDKTISAISRWDMKWESLKRIPDAGRRTDYHVLPKHQIVEHSSTNTSLFEAAVASVKTVRPRIDIPIKRPGTTSSTTAPKEAFAQ